jgi:hypothetical protein
MTAQRFYCYMPSKSVPLSKLLFELLLHVWERNIHIINIIIERKANGSHEDEQRRADGSHEGAQRGADRGHEDEQRGAYKNQEADEYVRNNVSS